MAIFKLKRDLPRTTKDKLTRVEALSSGIRSDGENDFLTALTPYRYNRVLRWDIDYALYPIGEAPVTGTDDILEAEGRTLPTGDSGFKQGAIFYLLNTGRGRNAYVNVGTSTSATWSLPAPESAVSSESESASPSASLSQSPSASASESVSDRKSVV